MNRATRRLLTRRSIRAGLLRRRVVMPALLAASVGLAMAQWPAAALAQPAQAAAQAFDIDIPAQPLGQALATLSRQMGVQVFAPGELVAGKMAPTVKGRFGAQAALDRLLAGSGLAASLSGQVAQVRVASVAGTATTASETALPEVRVSASTEPMPGELPKPFAGGQVARGGRLGMLGNVDLFDTPFSTKAYTAELIQNQGARTLNDVVANDPSIRASLPSTTPLDQSYIRGFVLLGDNWRFDGMPNLAGYSTAAIQNFERVEVIKGPSAAFGGALDGVGGAYNLLPKRALDQPTRAVTLSLIDESLVGAHVDLGQRFGVDNRFGARLNFSAESGDQYNDTKRRMLAPQLALDFRGENSRLFFDAGATRYESSPTFTNFRLAPGEALPAVPDPRSHPKPAWETLEFESQFGLLSAEWDFAEHWTAYARYGRYGEEPPKRIAPNTTALNGAGEYQITGWSSYVWRQDNDVAETGLRGRLKVGATTHGLSLQAVYNRLEYHDERFFSEDAPARVTETIYRQSQFPNPFAAGIPDVDSFDYAPTYVNSLAVADSISMFDDRLKLTLALRHQRVKSAPYEQSNNTPTIAVLYKLGGGLSVYGNYAEALAQGETAPEEAANPGEQLPPFVSEQYEAGFKWDRGSYGLTAAVFEIRRASAFIDANNFFRANGQQRNRGVELETFGEPFKGTRVLGGVAWIDAVQTRTEGGATDGNAAIGVPRLHLNLGSEFDLTAVPGLTLTGRVIHTGKAYFDLQNTQEVPSWNRLDVGARYRTRLGQQRLILRAGIDNLLDRAYWVIGGRNFISVAPPRTWRLSASYDF